jgi:predicted pyridoxine 5'-phosphate oxidase superfamily flavin-nucleotide-binding protein
MRDPALTLHDAAPAGRQTGSMEAWPFHEGEMRAQHLAGGGSAGGGIRDFMPEQHRAFFAGLPFLLIGTTDAAGWPAATLLDGPPGFISSPDPHHLAIAGVPDVGDPVAPLLLPGNQIGLLGIDLATCRRNRANGVIENVSSVGLQVAVRESFGNCPKYIHRRAVVPTPRRASTTEMLHALDDAARRTIATADTAFVATAGGALGGADISHRGGPSGFIAVQSDVLTIPDYRGNRYYNTLGNLLVTPRAALLLIDFVDGSILCLHGAAEIEWTRPDQTAFPGAERVWRLHVESGWRRQNAIALRWEFVEDTV